MRVKNNTPFVFGVKATRRHASRVEMLVVVRAKLDLVHGGVATIPDGMPLLVQGSLSGDIFGEGDDEGAGECLYASDFSDFKPRADLLLSGTCHTPRARPMRRCPVELRVGEWSKQLWVYGPRVWTERPLGGERPSEPAPFSSMPLSYRHSFGGAAYDRNPVGIGIAGDALPNIESAQQPLQSRSDRLEPAGFGPISPSWPQRRDKLQSLRAGGFDEHFDWSYFNAAPRDQQLERYLRGDETLRVTNVHGEHAVYRSRLPGIVVRAFVKTVQRPVQEARLVCDTLLVDMHDDVAMVTWRGHCRVDEDDLSDVSALLLVQESLDDEATPFADHERTLLAFERDPVGDAVPEELKPAWQSIVEAETDDAVVASSPLARAAEMIGTVLGAVSEPERARIESSLEQAQILKLPDGRSLDASIADNLSQAAPAAAPPAAPDAARDKALAAARQRLEAIEAQAPRQGHTMPGLERVDERLRRLESQGSDRPELGPGCDLSGADLSHQDLRDVDLRGAKLVGTNLFRAKLEGAVLADADLRDAILAYADLRRTDLSRANLSAANLHRARADEASLSEATLDMAIFDETSLQRAGLDDARGKLVVMSKVDLSGASLQRSVLEQALLSGACLDDADLRHARLLKCCVMKASALQVNLAHAVVDGTSFAQSTMKRATLLGVGGEGAIFMGTDLADADLSFAKLPRAHFLQASLVRARLFSADLRGANFTRASMRRTDMTKANLMGASFRKSVAHDATFEGANLYAGVFIASVLQSCNFADANLKMSSLDTR